MSRGLHRMCALVIFAAGVALSAWAVFGAPHDWHGVKALGRLVLAGLGTAGVIGGSGGLLPPDTLRDGPRSPQDESGPGGGEE